MPNERLAYFFSSAIRLARLQAATQSDDLFSPAKLRERFPSLSGGDAEKLGREIAAAQDGTINLIEAVAEVGPPPTLARQPEDASGVGPPILRLPGFS